MLEKKVYEGAALADLIGKIEEAVYDVYSVRIKLREKLYGGVPKNQDIIAAWQRERIKKAAKAGLEIVSGLEEKELEEVKNQIEISEDQAWCSFFTKDSEGEEIGPWIASINIKAMLREALFSLGITAKKMGGRGFKQFFQHSVHVTPSIIPVGDITGYEENTGQVSGPQGTRQIITRHDYILQPEICFNILVVASGMLTAEELISVLVKAQENGLGARRGQEKGKFDLVSFEHVNTGKIKSYGKKADKEAEEEPAA